MGIKIEVNVSMYKYEIYKMQGVRFFILFEKGIKM